MRSKKIHLLALILAAFMLLTSTAFAAPTSDEGLLSQPGPLTANVAVFDQGLANAYRSGDEVFDVLVYLKEEVDAGAYQRRYEAETGYSRELVARDMVGEMKQVAAVTQAPLTRYLQSQKMQGYVEDFESFFIVNAMHVIANRSVLEQLSTYPGIRAIQLNEEVELPDEPGEEVEIDVNAPTIAENIKQVGAPGVWKEYGIDGTGSVVGIIDSGVDFGHPALKNKWRGYDPSTDSFIEPEKSWFEAIPSYFIEQSPIPVDSRLTHGTHCIGTAIGSDEAKINQIGVAPGAKYIAARAFNADGVTEDYVLLRAMQWMIAPGGDTNAKPDVINCSWSDSRSERIYFQEVIKKWRAAGIFPAFAAGNQRGDELAPGPYSIDSPASLPEAFAIGAVNNRNELAPFSKQGPSIFDKDKDVKKIKPDVSAPGINVMSSVIGGGYAMKNGTSMATPHVAGAVALLRQANPDMTISEMEEVLRHTATPTTDGRFPESPNMGYGYGVLNVYEAVGEVMDKDFAVIRGRTLIAGEDNNAPTVRVTIPEAVYYKQNIEVEIVAEDDLGVSELTFEVKPNGSDEWIEVKVVQQEGNPKSGRYIAKIDGAIVTDGEMLFRWKAKDSYGNETTGEDSRVIRSAIDPVQGYFNDFETQDEGWLFKNSFKRDYMNQYVMPDHVGAYSGQKVIATDPFGYEIENNKEHWAIAPPIDLSDETVDQPSVEFMARYFHKDDYTLKAYVSTDNTETWQEVRTFKYDMPKWILIHVDLSEFKGNDHVLFKIEMTKKEGYDRGVYIDDFKVTSNKGMSPNPPTDLSAAAALLGVKVSFVNSPEYPEIEKYYLYRSDASANDFAKVAEKEVYDKGLAAEPFVTDQTAVSGESYKYYVTAVDFFGNESQPSVETTIDYVANEPIYFSNFDEDDGGLTHEALGANAIDDWEWGFPAKHLPDYETKLWGTNFNKGVSPDSEYALYTPELEIPAGGANLAFNSRMSLWWSSDPTQASGWAHVEVKEQGGDWIEILQPSDLMQFPDQKKWIQAKAPLTAFAGKTAQIRFRLQTQPHANSNPDFPELGWYIDNLQILPPDMSITSHSANSVDPIYYDMTPAEIEALNREFLDSVEHDEDVEVTAMPEPLPAQTIPLPYAVVSIVETGQNIKSSMIGEYELRPQVPAEGRTVTLEAVAEGYKPHRETVDLKAGDDVLRDIILEPLKIGQIKGTLLDAATNEPVVGYVRLLDSDKDSVKTNENGEFMIADVYEGEHTLRVSAEGYAAKDVDVTVLPEQTAEETVLLDKVDEFNEWVYYDNGSNWSLGWKGAGVGFANKFIAEGKGVLRGGSVFFVNDRTDFWGFDTGIGVLKEDPVLGTLETLVEFGSHRIQRGAWNYFDFTKYGIEVEPGDIIYISTLQLNEGGNNPAVGMDRFAPNSDMSFIYNGSMRKIIEEDPTMVGAMCIRAKFAYTEKAIDAPVFNDLAEVNYYNTKEVTLTGTTTEDGEVIVTYNGEELPPVTTENKTFSIDVTLGDGENTVSAKLKAIGDRVSEASAEHILILDQTAPEITIETPADGDKFDVAEIEVTGTFVEEHLDKILVNGRVAEIEGNTYRVTVPLLPGKNLIQADAFDMAGTRARAEITVYMPVAQFDVERIMGGSRYTTATEFSKRSFESADTVIICSGTSMADALTAGPLGIKLNAPILLTRKGDLPKATKQEIERLGAEDFIIIGGDLVVGPEVEAELAELGSVRRLAGGTRYSTSVAVAEEVLKNNITATAIFCGGNAMADAVAIAPFSDRVDSNGVAPIVLVDENHVPELKGISRGLIVGGKLVVTSETETALHRAGYSTERLAGSNRYTTSVMIAERFVEQPESVVLANGNNLTDALVSSLFCNRHHLPLLLTPGDKLDEAVVNYIDGLNLHHAYIAGGTLAISEDVELQLYQLKW